MAAWHEWASAMAGLVRMEAEWRAEVGSGPARCRANGECDNGSEAGAHRGELDQAWWLGKTGGTRFAHRDTAGHAGNAVRRDVEAAGRRL